MREDTEKPREQARHLRQTMPAAERLLWLRLRRRRLDGYHFRRQHAIGPFIVDFACLSQRLVIVVDGPVHDFPEQVEQDARRSRFLRAQGWSVLRITSKAVFDQTEQILAEIRAHLPPQSSNPAGSPAAPPPAGERVGNATLLKSATCWR